MNTNCTHATIEENGPMIKKTKIDIPTVFQKMTIYIL